MPARRLETILATALGLLAIGCGSGGNPASPASANPGTTAGPAAMEAAPLKQTASSTGRLMGTAVKSSLLRESTYAAVFARHFDFVTAEYEMKWGQIERTQGQRDYAGSDAIVDFALAQRMQIKGHALVWHGDSPAWLESLSPADARRALEDHIRTTLGRYRGQIGAWDVVNEAIADGQPGLRDTVYLRKLGPDYIAEAFRLARAADPDVLLIYNDYGAEGSGRKSDDVYALVKDLKQRGVPIGGVGLQMHLDALSRPTTAEIAANLRRLGDLGLKVNISEMDVRVARVSGTQAVKLEEQRKVYHDVVAVCRAEPACHAITFWGFTDAQSWIDSVFGPDDPLLFDEQYRVKPAYTGVAEALAGR